MFLETERLVLRPFRQSDAEDVLEYLREPAVNCFECMRLNSLGEATAEVRKRSENTEYHFAIELKENGRVIGEVNCFPEPNGPDEPYPSNDTFSPYWMLNPGYQGKGYAYEAVHTIFNYLFREKEARRIYIYTEDYNIRCQRLCERLGMRREGFFKEFISFVKNPDGTPLYENTYQYAILSKEWDLAGNQ